MAKSLAMAEQHDGPGKVTYLNARRARNLALEDHRTQVGFGFATLIDFSLPSGDPVTLSRRPCDGLIILSRLLSDDGHMHRNATIVLPIVVLAGYAVAFAQPTDAPALPPAPPPTATTTPPLTAPDDQAPLATPDEPTTLAEPVEANDGDTAKKKRKLAKHAKHDHKVTVSGFVAALYKFRVDQGNNNVHEADAFRMAKVVARLKGRISSYVGYTVEIDPRSPTIAGVLRDGYIALYVIPHHTIRIGQQKVPFGYENWISSTEIYTIYRSSLSEGMGRGVTHRDIGIGLVGNLKLAKGLRLEDAVALVNGAGFGVQADDTELKNVWGRVGLRYIREDLDLIIHTGLSGAIGDQVEPTDPAAPLIPGARFKFKRLGGDLEVEHRWFYAGAEYGTSWDQRPAETGPTERTMAYLVMVAGKTPWHVGPVVRYDAGDVDDYKRWTIGVYYGEPTAQFRVLTNYEYTKDVTGVHDGRVTTQATVKF